MEVRAAPIVRNGFLMLPTSAVASLPFLSTKSVCWRLTPNSELASLLVTIPLELIVKTSESVDVCTPRSLNGSVPVAPTCR